jgi:hypothetical protein
MADNPATLAPRDTPQIYKVVKRSDELTDRLSAQ